MQCKRCERARWMKRVDHLRRKISHVKKLNLFCEPKTQPVLRTSRSKGVRQENAMREKRENEQGSSNPLQKGSVYTTIMKTISFLLLVTTLLGPSLVEAFQPSPRRTSTPLRSLVDDFSEKWEALEKRQKDYEHNPPNNVREMIFVCVCVARFASLIIPRTSPRVNCHISLFTNCYRKNRINLPRICSN